MQAFEKAAQQTKEEREKILNVKDDIIKEHLAEAEAAKKRQLAAFDKIAQKGGGRYLISGFLCVPSIHNVQEMVVEIKANTGTCICLDVVATLALYQLNTFAIN